RCTCCWRTPSRSTWTWRPPSEVMRTRRRTAGLPLAPEDEPLQLFLVSSLARPVRKDWKIFRVSLIERMTYRTDSLLATFLRFLPMVTTILLWTAVFEGAGQDELNGFTRNRMIAYLLLVHISRMFSSMPGLASGIARDIRDGSLKKYLLQPIDMIGYLLSYRAAHKAAYIVASSLPYALLFFLCRDYFE